MARISSYNQDPNLEAQDRLVGSDVSNANQTVNFSLASLGDFYTKSGLADATRLGYRFNYIAGTAPVMGDDIIPMGIYFDNIDFSMVTSITVGAADANGYGFGVLEDILNNGRIKIITTRARGTETRAQGYFNVSNFVEILNNAGNTVAGYRLDLTTTGLTNSQEGIIRTGSGTNEPDDSFIILPLSPTQSAAGNVNHAWRNFVVGGTTIDADGTEDTLTLIAGNDIALSGTDLDGGGSVTFSHESFGTTGTLTNSDNTFIQSITVDNGHITGVVTGQAAGMQTSQLAFPTLSGNVREAGFSGAAHSHTFTLSGTDGFTIDPALANNVATLAENTIGTATVNPTWTATQDNLMTHTMAFSETRTLTTFRPFYTEIFNTVPTVFTFAPGKRVLQEVTSGGTIQLNPGALTNPEALIVVPNDDFPEQTRDSNDRYVSGVRFRTGGFLFIVPEAQFSVTGPSGTLYTAYVISLSPGSTLELEII